MRFTEDLSTGDFSAHFPAKGTEGTAEGSFCEYGDYHGVTVLFDDGKHIDVKEDYLEHVEDPYEYAVVRDSNRPYWATVKDWVELHEAERRLKILAEGMVGMQIVKRRKAGRIEEL